MVLAVKVVEGDNRNVDLSLAQRYPTRSPNPEERMLTIDRLIELKGVIKWNAVFGEAGLNPNTMRSAVHHQRELRPDEAQALLAVLRNHGLDLGPSSESRPQLRPQAQPNPRKQIQHGSVAHV